MKKWKLDYILLGTTIALLVLGVLILASVSASLSMEMFGTTYYFLRHQLLFGVIPGLFLAFLAFQIRLSFIKKWVPIILLGNLVLLAMVFLPGIGTEIRGATRWLDLGVVSFQPAEFLKLTFILYLAAWLASQTSKKNSRETQKTKSLKPKDLNTGHLSQTFAAFLVVIGIISFILISQPDISTLGIIVMVGLLMYFSSGTPFWHSILMFLAGAGGLFALIKLAPYRMNRFLVFLNPETDPMGIGYQIKQSLIAVGSGGILGLGLGMSVQKFGFLPQSMSDSIFAIFSEETGFLGSLILVVLFLLFFLRAFKISKESKDKFSQLAALGIGCWIILQGFVNISSMIGIMPLTGIPLPFISYGGSSLVTELVGAGILLNISRQKT